VPITAHALGVTVRTPWQKVNHKSPEFHVIKVVHGVLGQLDKRVVRFGYLIAVRHVQDDHSCRAASSESSNWRIIGVFRMVSPAYMIYEFLWSIQETVQEACGHLLL